MLGLPSVCAAKQVDVLVVYSQFRFLPANLQVDAGLIRPEDLLPASQVRFFTEFLDYPFFEGDAHEQQMAKYLQEKYAGKPPAVLIAGGYTALKFALRYRDKMFPGVPVIHVGVDKDFLKNLAPMPPDVVGLPLELDIDGTLELALQLQPNARRLVVVTGTTPWAAERRADIGKALAQIKTPVPVEFWTGLATNDLLARLRTLTTRDVVFTPGYYRDGAGTKFTPSDAVRLMAKESPAPIYIMYSGQLGTGVMGGRMGTFTDAGKATRLLVEDVIAGKPLAMGTYPTVPARPQLDWRQLQRFGIPDDRLPPDTVLHYRTPTFWEVYKSQTLTAAFIILAQGSLIIALLFERRRRRRTAEALMNSRERTRVIAQSARVGLIDWRLDPEETGSKHLTAANEELMGDQPESFANVLDSVHPSDREKLSEATRHTIDTGEELNLEFRIVDNDGAERWNAVRANLAHEGKHRITGVRMDVSDRKKVELQATEDRAALSHLTRVSTMGQLSAAIAHQLNQPLTSILGNAETGRKMLNRVEPPIAELKEVLDDIVEENGRAADIIRNLTSLYRRGPSDRATFELNELVLDTLELLRSDLISRSAITRVELAPDLPAIEGTRLQLQQVLLNLITNGVDAMSKTPVGKRVLVIKTSMSDGHVEFCVSDRGTGIAPDALVRLFDPFWTTKGHGVGVGLTISRAIVEAHGGSVTATNNPQGGATFRVCLPIPQPTH